MDLSQFGTPVGAMTRVNGGFANRMYRLDTDQGLFAVQERPPAFFNHLADLETLL